jgi:hypothetical protein
MMKVSSAISFSPLLRTTITGLGGNIPIRPALGMGETRVQHIFDREVNLRTMFVG